MLKGLVMTAVVRVCKYPIPVALMIGLGLAQIGEFSFILVSTQFTINISVYCIYVS